ncbi:hypothetical protein N7497_004053, partial [Penicillium chrysogenum]
PKLTSPAAPQDPRHIVISGPSGVGKAHCSKSFNTQILIRFASPYSIRRRSHDRFSSLLEQDGFVEHPCFSGKYYGTTNKL